MTILILDRHSNEYMISSIYLEDGSQIHPITKTSDFFIISKYQGQPIDIRKWSLCIDGTVSTPLSLSYEAITTCYSRRTEIITMECVINPTGGALVGTAMWTGVPLHELFKEVDVQPTAIELLCTCLDELNRGFPLTYFSSPRTLLAYEMNAAPLPLNYGYPLRLIVPEYYGFVWLKWLTKLTLTSEPYSDPKWRASMNAIKSKKLVPTTKILRPHPNEVIATTPYLITGMAWGSETPIQHIEVSDDHGESWTRGDIIWPAPHSDAWSLWTCPWTPPQRRTVTLTVRTLSNQDPGPDDSVSAHTQSTTTHQITIQIDR
jgi:DMSO/TMAO reductase YedYZ molybdopterin-dependent catalytic subunit